MPARKRAASTKNDEPPAKKQKTTRELIVGEEAQDFTLTDDSGTERSLKDFAGKQLVIFFYPKDNTSGCTTEACSFRDNYETFQKNNVEVVGVSIDSVKSHANWKKKKEFPFLLLSDEDLELINLYGMKSPRGKGAKRATVVIDEEGKIEKVYASKVDPKTHVNQILADLGIEREGESSTDEDE